jgi:hypothetical protein
VNRTQTPTSTGNAHRTPARQIQGRMHTSREPRPDSLLADYSPNQPGVFPTGGRDCRIADTATHADHRTAGESAESLTFMALERTTAKISYAHPLPTATRPCRPSSAAAGTARRRLAGKLPRSQVERGRWGGVATEQVRGGRPLPVGQDDDRELVRQPKLAARFGLDDLAGLDTVAGSSSVFTKAGGGQGSDPGPRRVRVSASTCRFSGAAASVLETL